MCKKFQLTVNFEWTTGGCLLAAVLGIVYAAQLKSVGVVVVVHEVLTLNGVAEVDHWRGIGKDQLLLLLKLKKAVCS